MDARLDILSRTFSHALDIIEGELFGATEYHSMRTAVLCAAMGKRLGFDEEALSALTICALFHDNALTEYMLSEREGEHQALNLRLHCEYGQRNVENLPFKKNIAGFILYHHEFANGSGPFGKKEGEYPLEAGLIAAADTADVLNRLQRVPMEDLPRLRRGIRATIGARSPGIAEILLSVLDGEMLLSLRNDAIAESIKKAVPVWTINMEDPSILRIAGMVARVIDYKSVFTRKHTLQIANKSWLMGEYYGYGESGRAQLYLAAALHDIGKIAVPVRVLEKPGRLDEAEFEIIKQHVVYTREWLGEIEGFEKICDWASNHHEKLDGSGYPAGKKAEDLNFNSRLLACIDIYQAISEERPYHPARSHGETMPILYDMAAKGEIDLKIVKDMDPILEPYSNRDVPPPELPQVPAS
jgi:HD-GYP domain-containing protein (c-di-GMP phosphodiesterase class II)